MNVFIFIFGERANDIIMPMTQIRWEKGVHSNVPFIKYVKQHVKTNNAKENKTKQKISTKT